MILLLSLLAQASDPPTSTAAANPIGLAVDAWNSGDLRSAEDLLTQAIAVNDAPDARLLRGQVRYDAGDVQGAIDDLAPLFGGSEWKVLFDKGKSGAWEGMDAIVVAGAATLVLAHRDAGDTASANAVVQMMKAVEAPTPALALAEFEVARMSGEDAHARSLLDAAKKRWPGDPALDEAEAALEAAANDWREAFNGAVDAHNAEQWSACTAALQPILDADPKVAALAYTCAVRGGDLSTADTVWTEHRQGLSPSVVVAHANLRAAKGSVDSAIALLDALAPEDGLDTKAKLLANAGRLDEAIPLALSANVDPTTSRNIAALLANEGRLDDAAPILEGACARMDGEAKKDCQLTLSSVEEHRAQ